MLATQLITNHYPTIEPEDKISLALQLMEDFDITHLPVVDHNKYIGLISKEDLLDAEEFSPVKGVMPHLIQKSVKATDHYLTIIKVAAQHSLSIVPVVNQDHEWVGAIPYTDILKASSMFVGAEEPGAVIVLEMERKSYSFGEITRLVETNDAYITQFNTFFENETGLLVVTIKINKSEVSDILSTFQRYEYIVRNFIGEEQYENELRYNYEHLMSYLKF